MPTSGSGTGTPIPVAPGGLGSGPKVATPIPYTLLSLGRYAKIMGINPAHFMRSVAPNLSPALFPSTSCAAIWPRYPWQNLDMSSHEELAYSIKNAEEDIAKAIHYYPAPAWIAEDNVEYTKDSDPTLYGVGINVRGSYKSVQTSFGYVSEMGRRATTLIGTPTVLAGTLAYSDEDLDGFYETATIQIATTVTNTKEIHIYFAGTLADPDWEIRPLNKVTISAGTLTIKLSSLFLIDPDLLSDYPSENGFVALDVSTIANFVTSLDVYREYCDATQNSAEFCWDQYRCSLCGGVGCPVCVGHVEYGCSTIRFPKIGAVVPLPASYNSTTGEWELSTNINYPEPNTVKLWYRAGEQSKEYRRNQTLEPLSDWWAQTIAWLATSRLERPLCECENVSKLYDYLRRDEALSAPGEGSYMISITTLDNPFGTRKGEILCWNRISKLVRRSGVALI